MKRDDPRHGTQNGYGNLGCRCDQCRKAHADYQWRNRYNLTQLRRAEHRRKYAIAREAGYSSREARRRCLWSDPLADRSD